MKTAGRAADQVGAILVHHGLLPYQDTYLARFETWSNAKLRSLPPPISPKTRAFESQGGSPVPRAFNSGEKS